MLTHSLPYILAVAGIIGFIAASILTLEKIELIRDPSFVPSCNFNPILNCGSVMDTPQSQAFGFPNSLLGIAGFAVITTVGTALLAGATFKRWFWLGLQAGVTLGLLFIFWLQYQSLYEIGALCPYCMVVWAVTIPTFWYVTLHNLRQGHLGLRLSGTKLTTFLQRHHGDVLLAWFLLLIGLIVHRFWYFWSTLI